MANTTQLFINEAYFQKSYGKQAPERIAERNEKLKGFTLKTFSYKTAKIPAAVVSLKGSHGEIAYVRHDGTSMFDFDHMKLIVEYPLDLDATLQRKWLQIASNFYKPRFKRVEEVVLLDEPFVEITKKPYKEEVSSYTDYEEEDPDLQEVHIKTRYRLHNEKSPYGSKTTSSQFHTKRNRWLKDEYAKLRRSGNPETECYVILKDRLAVLSKSFFGKTCQPKTKRPLSLSIDRIKFIVQSKKS